MSTPSRFAISLGPGQDEATRVDRWRLPLRRYLNTFSGWTLMTTRLFQPAIGWRGCLRDLPVNSGRWNRRISAKKPLVRCWNSSRVITRTNWLASRYF